MSRPESETAAPARGPGAEAPTRRRPAVMAGLTGGLIGATCCVGPAVGIATGAGAGSFLLSMGRYRPLLFVVGAIAAFAIAGVVLARRRSSCPTPQAYRSLRSRWLDVVMVSFALTYAIGRFVVPPLIERL